MCGIAGYVVAPGGMPPDAATGERMNDVIRHRGPDDGGVYCDARALLGMRRLSIIDLAAGHQPIGNADGSVQLVFNGEIYNYRELRAELIARGHGFRTHSDSEVIVQAYEAWGEACFERLHGMFAIALWDTRTQTLLIRPAMRNRIPHRADPSWIRLRKEVGKTRNTAQITIVGEGA